MDFFPLRRAIQLENVCDTLDLVCTSTSTALDKRNIHQSQARTFILEALKIPPSRIWTKNVRCCINAPKKGGQKDGIIYFVTEVQSQSGSGNGFVDLDVQSWEGFPNQISAAQRPKPGIFLPCRI